MHSIPKIPAFFLWIFLCLVVILGCQGKVDANSSAPDFSLSDIEGHTVSLRQFAGKVVLLDFWATWCPPCRMTIPELIKLKKKHKELVILGVSLDSPQTMNNDSLKAFKKQFGINYRILRGNVQVISSYFGNQRVAIPTIFLIGRDQKIVTKIVGYDPTTLEKAISKVMP